MREKPEATLDIKLRNVTITLLPKTKGRDEGEKRVVEVADESEGGEVSFGISDQSTPVEKGETGGRQLARRAVERSTLAKYGKALPVANEAEESAREETDDPFSEAERDDEVRMTVGEMRGLTQALVGAVQMLKALVKRLNLDKDNKQVIKEVGRVIEGIATSLDQCIGQKGRRRTIKPGQVKVEEAGRKLERKSANLFGASEYPKRKVVSPVEGNKVTSVTKRSRRRELTYAEMCGRPEAHRQSDRERSDDSDGWQTVKRRRREKKKPPESLPARARGVKQGELGRGRGLITRRRRRS